jgi:hypothetical protein
MPEPRHGGRLAPEPILLGWPGQFAAEEHLQRYDLAGGGLPGPIHDPHPALGNRLEQIVRTEALGLGRDGQVVETQRLRPGRVVRVFEGVLQRAAWAGRVGALTGADEPAARARGELCGCVWRWWLQ